MPDDAAPLSSFGMGRGNRKSGGAFDLVIAIAVELESGRFHPGAERELSPKTPVTYGEPQHT
jgi:hypothetical protein